MELHPEPERDDGQQDDRRRVERQPEAVPPVRRAGWLEPAGRGRDPAEQVGGRLDRLEPGKQSIDVVQG